MDPGYRDGSGTVLSDSSLQAHVTKRLRGEQSVGARGMLLLRIAPDDQKSAIPHLGHRVHGRIIFLFHGAGVDGAAKSQWFPHRPRVSSSKPCSPKSYFATNMPHLRLAAGALIVLMMPRHAGSIINRRDDLLLACHIVGNRYPAFQNGKEVFCEPPDQARVKLQFLGRRFHKRLGLRHTG